MQYAKENEQLAIGKLCPLLIADCPLPQQAICSLIKSSISNPEKY